MDGGTRVTEPGMGFGTFGTSNFLPTSVQDILSQQMVGNTGRTVSDYGALVAALPQAAPTDFTPVLDPKTGTYSVPGQPTLGQYDKNDQGEFIVHEAPGAGYGAGVHNSSLLKGLARFAGLALPIFAPALAPALAASLGVSQATAQALIAAAGGAAGGGASGGLEGALLGAAAGGLGSAAGSKITSALGGLGGGGAGEAASAGGSLAGGAVSPGVAAATGSLTGLVNEVSPVIINGALNTGLTSAGGSLGGLTGSLLNSGPQSWDKPLTEGPKPDAADQSGNFRPLTYNPGQDPLGWLGGVNTVDPIDIVGSSSPDNLLPGPVVTPGLTSTRGGLENDLFTAQNPKPPEVNPINDFVGQTVGSVIGDRAVGGLAGLLGLGPPNLKGVPDGGFDNSPDVGSVRPIPGLPTGGGGGGVAPTGAPAPTPRSSGGGGGGGSAAAPAAPALSTAGAAPAGPGGGGPGGDLKLQGSLAPDIYPWRKLA